MPSTLKTSAIIMASVLGVLLLVGTLWDEQISQMLYDPSSWFGIVFAAYGEVPVVMALATGGTMLIRARSRHRRAVTIGQVTAGGALLALAAAIAVVMPARYLDVHILLLTGIGVLLIAGSVLFARWLARGAERKATASVAVIIVVVVLVELATVYILKFPFERPRVRFLTENPDLAFQPWYDIGNEAMDEHLASGVARDEFKSFPSGHTANGAALMLLAVIAPLQASLARHQALLMWIGAVWALLVGASRIVIGAHFISDTVAGFTITFLLVLIALQVVHRRLAPAPAVKAALP